jgi:hypothetical protein
MLRQELGQSIRSKKAVREGSQRGLVVVLTSLLAAWRTKAGLGPFSETKDVQWVDGGPNNPDFTCVSEPEPEYTDEPLAAKFARIRFARIRFGYLDLCSNFAIRRACSHSSTL